MRKTDLTDLSAIQQKRQVNQSQKTLEQSKKQVHICCPYVKAENYQCSICNRLRNVCPSTHQHQHQQASSLFSVQETSMYNKRDVQSLRADRLRTFSMNESLRNPQVSRQVFKKQISPIPWQQNIRTQIVIPQTQQIIYYPVIHNVLKTQPFQKSTQSTPIRRSKKQVFEEYNDRILTPTQFKQLIDSVRLQ